MSTFKLHVRDLGKHFGRKRVFESLTFTHSGGTLGISGPNGSGKSTLMQCIAGLQRPSSGSVAWRRGDQPIEQSSMNEHTGYAAPYINLYAELTCGENLRFLMQLRNAQKHAEQSIEQVLQLTNILDLQSQLFGNLSTGQQQRLRLAAALVHQPEILLLDEPGSNLDEKGRALIETLVYDFKEAKRLVIVASNNPGELILCDRVYSVREEDFV